MYNYFEAVKEDVLQAIRDNYTEKEIAVKLYEDREEFEQKLNDDLWIDDSVTGNGSGSYTFSNYKASENLVGNYGLVREVVDEFCIDASTVAENIDNPEYWDVSIRCFYLCIAVDEALDELEDDEEIHEIIERLKFEE